jgi:serine/threonine protein phosphatase 1
MAENPTEPAKRDGNATSAPRGLLSRIFGRKPEASAVPVGVRVYAIGDIHGRLDLLDGMQEKIARDGETATGERIIVYLGDYIDRGADSKGVIERLLAPPPKGFSARHLKGNHDQSLLDFLEDPAHYRMWKDYGARETLLSYAVMPPRGEGDSALKKASEDLALALPESHLKFVRGLELSVTIGDYFFVHAGVRPGLPLNKQSPQDLMWIREEFLTSSSDFGKVVVHGHSPSPMPVKRANRIGVDTGAYATGRLSCVVLEGTSCRFLQTGT